MEKKARKLLEEEIKALQAIPLTGIEDAVKTILSCKGKVVCIGMGKAGLIARKVAATFASTGTPAFFMHPSEAQHGDLGMFGKGDMIIAFSNSGKTYEVIKTLELSKILVPDAKLVVVTSKPKSRLAKLADIVIDTGGHPECCPLGMAPTCSTTAMIVIGDILSMLTMKEKGITVEDYAKRHHGGYLGRKAKKARKK